MHLEIEKPYAKNDYLKYQRNTAVGENCFD